MHPKQAKKTKRAPNAERPFPWRCCHCGKQEVVMATTQYDTEVRHDGRLHIFTIPRLELPVCQACGQKVFTEQVDAQVNNALRAHLTLLTPAQIRDGIKRVGLSQKDVAARLGIAAATLSRWLNETQIQSRAMDNLLRAFLAFPQLRTALSGESQDPGLGISDAMSGERSGGHSHRTKQRGNAAVDAQWLDDWNGRRDACREVQKLVQKTGSTWGTTRVA
jgi:putative zinc finger/helix-turn-helix YgiT family protein